MARRFGSKDSYKRNPENYRGRLPGSKDVSSRGGFGYWLHYEEERIKKDGWRLGYICGKELIGEAKDRYWRVHYLGELLGIFGRKDKRYQFRVPRIIYMQTNLIDDNFYLWQRVGQGKRKFELRPQPLSPLEIFSITKQNKKTRLWWQRIEEEFNKLDSFKD